MPEGLYHRFEYGFIVDANVPSYAAEVLDLLTELLRKALVSYEVRYSGYGYVTVPISAR
jgi:hypothetical protein